MQPKRVDQQPIEYPDSKRHGDNDRPSGQLVTGGRTTMDEERLDHHEEPHQRPHTKVDAAHKHDRLLTVRRESQSGDEREHSRQIAG